VRTLSQAGSALAEGELLQRQDAWNGAVSVERYLARCELKTARLFEASCELGALAAQAPAEVVEALRAFGRRIGLAFQILDDVLDVAGDPARTGKPRGTDLLDGTVTLPLILARERDAELAAVALRSIVTAGQAGELCERIEATGAPADATARALGIVAEGKRELAGLGLEEGQRRALDLVADSVVNRRA
jgi:geranylgeranyl pyrophosphate synthase